MATIFTSPKVRGWLIVAGFDLPLPFATASWLWLLAWCCSQLPGLVSVPFGSGACKNHKGEKRKAQQANIQWQSFLGIHRNCHITQLILSECKLPCWRPSP